tara:strand:- start:145 stop:282 length:138 start_codon:yes stop_codon:yes gene_type:complete
MDKEVPLRKSKLNKASERRQVLIANKQEFKGLMCCATIIGVGSSF